MINEREKPNNECLSNIERYQVRRKRDGLRLVVLFDNTTYCCPSHQSKKSQRVCVFLFLKNKNKIKNKKQKIFFQRERDKPVIDTVVACVAQKLQSFQLGPGNKK